MKTIDYEALLAKHKPKGHISDDANYVANALIRDRGIQAGHDLSRFLGVDNSFDNYMAIRAWVQARLDAHESYVLDEMCMQLGYELYDLLYSPGYQF